MAGFDIGEVFVQGEGFEFFEGGVVQGIGPRLKDDDVQAISQGGLVQRRPIAEPAFYQRLSVCRDNLETIEKAGQVDEMITGEVLTVEYFGDNRLTQRWLVFRGVYPQFVRMGRDGGEEQNEYESPHR